MFVMLSNIHYSKNKYNPQLKIIILSEFVLLYDLFIINFRFQNWLFAFSSSIIEYYIQMID